MLERVCGRSVGTYCRRGKEKEIPHQCRLVRVFTTFDAPLGKSTEFKELLIPRIGSYFLTVILSFW